MQLVYSFAHTQPVVGFVAQYIHKLKLLQVPLGSPALVAHSWPVCFAVGASLD